VSSAGFTCGVSDEVASSVATSVPACFGGKPVFSLMSGPKLARTKQATIKKYRLGDTVLYQSHDVTGGSGLFGAASRLAFKAITLTITVNDLAEGKRIECKDVVEMPPSKGMFARPPRRRGGLDGIQALRR